MDSYILVIDWEVPNMPPLVGPFETRAEADQFARINVPNGSWEVSPVRYPYSRQSAPADPVKGN